MKYFIVARYKKVGEELKEIDTIDIPERDIESTLKRNPLWKIVSEVNTDRESIISVPLTEEKPPEVDKDKGFQCPLCSKTSVSLNALRAHKYRYHTKKNEN